MEKKLSESGKRSFEYETSRNGAIFLYSATKETKTKLNLLEVPSILPKGGGWIMRSIDGDSKSICRI